MRSKKVKKSENLGLGIIFMLVIALIFLLSVVFKALDLYQKSEFNNDANFNLLLKSDSGAKYLSFSPKNQTINIVDIKGGQSDVRNLEIPTDATLNTNQEVTKTNIDSSVSSFVFKKGLNPFDSIKLLLFTKSVPSDSVHESLVNTRDNLENDKKLVRIFSDPQIVSEKLTIQILNSSGVNGAGAKAAKLITNIGGNVILVTTTETETPGSSVTATRQSLTFKKIKNLLRGWGKVDPGMNLSDIKIIIGRDGGGLL